MEKLRQVLAQEDTVLFIGSGISTWSGLPSWSALISELASFIESNGARADLVRSEVKQGNLLQAASYGFDMLTKQQIGEFIRSACRYGVAQPQEIHRLIVSLGPRCFVTTNYDNLIEESLRKWQPDRFFQSPVTNRHLTETAGIIHARASDFIFKPHGDAADSESIILTREQYRQLLPGGERHAALESLKTLLATRPVVYLGFGLNDPDFNYVRDLLLNTYKGGTRDHYAIMADVSETQRSYWRRHYGIHLISYATSDRADKTRDHKALLNLLDTLISNTAATPNVVGVGPCSPEIVLALARHAAGLTRSAKVPAEFQIRVQAEAEMENRKGSGLHLYRHDRFDHYTVEKFLDEGPERALLIGLPGAGKTYSLRRAAARLAEKLHGDCLSETFDENAVFVPILADLKLYRGDLGELVNQTLPKSLPLDGIVTRFKVKIFLDSFNEMPKEYRESGSYELDFAGFIDRAGGASLVIGSRTKDGLDKLGLPAYNLDLIDKADVTAELQRLGIQIEGRFDREVRSLLQRPFYFQYVLSGAVSLPTEAHPRDFYRVFFENLRNAFAVRFSEQVDIEKALSLAGYEALNRGEEAFPLTELLRALKTNLDSVGLANIEVRDIANWLVSSSVLIPYSGGRVAFVHQSVTEYLAATELARRYQSNSHILQEKLSLTRWDQALFLTLSLLPPAQADVFFQEVVKADFVLALNAIKYLEVERDDVVSRLLSEIHKRTQVSSPFDWKIESALEYGLPLTYKHEPHLRALIKCGNMLAAAAVKRLVALKGEEVKDELLQLLVEHCDDYNFCTNGIAAALEPFSKDEDAKKLSEWATTITAKVTPSSTDDATHGFASGAAAFLAGLDLSVIRQAFLPPNETMEIPEIHAEILCNILDTHNSTVALDFAGELVLRGVNRAATSIYFIANVGKTDNNLSWTSFSRAHVDQLESILDDPCWALRALTCLCAARPDLFEFVKQKALTKTGIEKAALLYCASPADLKPIFQALYEITEMSPEERQEQKIHLFYTINIDWSGNEKLFVKILRLQDAKLARALFGGKMSPSVHNLGNLDIEPIDWWFEWMMEEATTEDGYWFCHQLGSLFTEHVNNDVKDKFVSKFNKSDSKYRRLLLLFVLPHLRDITTDVFSEDAISFLLADLKKKRNGHSIHDYFLGWTATEQFINERLLPLLPNAKQTLLKNLHQVLKEAGSRHGRRYVLE